MNRISRIDMFMQMIDIISQRSTCNRKHVAAILARENRVISIGYNGPPRS